MKKPVVLSFPKSGSIVKGPVLRGTLNSCRPKLFLAVKPRISGKDLVMSIAPKADPGKPGRKGTAGGNMYFVGWPFWHGAGTNGETSKCEQLLFV